MVVQCEADKVVGGWHMAKRRRHIIGAILIIWIAFFITDFSLAKKNKAPVFAIPVIRHKDGGSTEYYGLGYKVIKYINLTVESGPEVENVAFGTWLMRFSPAQSTTVSNGEEIKDPKDVLWDRIPMVRIEGNLYLDTGKESDIDGRCGVMDGEITSTVDASEIPMHNNQSNFGKGYEYQHVDENCIDIFMNEKWMRFKKENNTWGIKLTATNVSPTGLTLLFNQSGGNPSGDLQTGSLYWLEVLIDNQWIPVEMLPSANDIGWTDEAYIINMNDITEWEVNWEWLYGELPIGRYRIGKEIMDFRSTGGIYDTLNYYADFEIVE